MAKITKIGQLENTIKNVGLKEIIHTKYVIANHVASELKYL